MAYFPHITGSYYPLNTSKQPRIFSLLKGCVLGTLRTVQMACYFLSMPFCLRHHCNNHSSFISEVAFQESVLIKMILYVKTMVIEFLALLQGGTSYKYYNMIITSSHFFRPFMYRGSLTPFITGGSAHLGSKFIMAHGPLFSQLSA